VTKKTIALDIMREVGQGNTFLTHPHTARNFRSQMFLRSKKSELFGATMSDRMVPEAREIARKLLREHTVKPLDKNMIAEGSRIVADYEKTGR